MISRTQVQFIRIGDQFINVDQIAYVDFFAGNEYNPRSVTIFFAAVGPEGYNMTTTYTGADAAAIEQPLRSHLGLATVAHIDLPPIKQEANWQPKGDHPSDEPLVYPTPY
jgi:hypothetical protein